MTNKVCISREHVHGNGSNLYCLTYTDIYDPREIVSQLWLANSDRHLFAQYLQGTEDIDADQLDEIWGYDIVPTLICTADALEK